MSRSWSVGTWWCHIGLPSWSAGSQCGLGGSRSCRRGCRVWLACWCRLPLTSSGQSSVKVDGGGDGGVHVSGAAEDEVGESWLRLLARLYGRMTSGRSFFFQEVQLQHEHDLKRQTLRDGWRRFFGMSQRGNPFGTSPTRLPPDLLRLD